MGKCHYCECDESAHDKRCPKRFGSFALTDWHLGWNHGFKGSPVQHGEDPCYVLGHEEGAAARKESERRVSIATEPRG